MTQKYEATKTNIEQILNSEETLKLSTLLRSLDDKIDTIPKKQGDLRQEKGILISSLSNYETTLEANRSMYALKEAEAKIYEEIFRREYALHYVMEGDGECNDLANKVIDIFLLSSIFE